MSNKFYPYHLHLQGFDTSTIKVKEKVITAPIGTIPNNSPTVDNTSLSQPISNEERETINTHTNPTSSSTNSKNKKGKLFLLLILITIFLQGYIQAQIPNINWSKVKIQSLPFYLQVECYSNEYPYNIVDSFIAKKFYKENMNDKQLRKEISNLYGGISNIFEYSYASKNLDSTARFYKRLANKYGYKVLIFAYAVRKAYMDCIAFDIQTFDTNNHCIDKMTISNIAYETCGGTNWKRTFSCDTNYIITLKDEMPIYGDKTYESSDYPIPIGKRTYKYKYIINKQGYFARYYPQKNGYINIPLYKDNETAKENYPKEKGYVKNHLREGLWHSDGYIMYYYQGMKINEEEYKQIVDKN